jgi:hypothetical protein
MKVRRAWLDWAVIGALILVFAGERIVPAVTPFRVALSGGGALLLVVATLARGMAWRRAAGDACAVEKIFLLAYLGCALAVVLFLLAGGLAARFGIDSDAFGTAAVVLGFVLLSASLSPLLAAQWALGSDYSPNEATVSVDRLRIAQVATAALTVGLALPFLLLTGYVTTERDKTVDLSYFKTSAPGTATQQTVGSLGAPLRVLLFFPPTSEVTDQLLTYFRALGEDGRQVQVEQVDRLVSPNLAEQFDVVTDGTVVLTSGDKTERIVLPTDLRQARLQLRTIDEDVQKSVLRLSRTERNVYMTIGHGELNDQASARATDTVSIASSTYFVESLLQYLNYGARELGLRAGLANDVPQDAAIVFVLGPRRPFLDAELRSLQRYIARGGSVLIALEPESEFELGPIAEQLGVSFSHTPLADDQSFVQVNQNISDRRALFTDNLYAHAALANSGQGVTGDAVVLLGAGSLRPIEEGAPGVSVIVRSKNTTFADSTQDYQPDPNEERLQYPLGIVVEAPAIHLADPKARAALFADSDMFTDVVLSRIGLNQQLLADVIRWLGHEEDLSGETTSEADIPIVHTRRENVMWFYSTILGAPGLVLALGLLGVRRRRARQTEASA